MGGKPYLMHSNRIMYTYIKQWELEVPNDE